VSLASCTWELPYSSLDIGGSSFAKKPRYHDEPNDPYRCYMYFIKYGFPIPAKKEEIEILKRKMRDFKAFQEYIDSEVRYHDLLQ
jgi:hypothetical protein